MTTVYRAAPVSRREIMEYARELRRKSGQDKVFFFPVMELLEIVLPTMFPDLTVCVVLVDELPLKEGETFPCQNLIMIREDVYIGACEGDGRSRFTVAHEIGHYLLHTPDSISLCRIADDKKLPAYEDPEWQANTFAGALLAPDYIVKGLSKSEISERCGISQQAAKVVIAKYKRH